MVRKYEIMMEITVDDEVFGHGQTIDDLVIGSLASAPFQVNTLTASVSVSEKNEAMTEEGIQTVMAALAGAPTLTSAKFADKVERILRSYR